MARDEAERRAVRRRLLYALAAGLLAAAVLVKLLPQRAGQLVAAAGRVLLEAWPSLLLVIVAVLVVAVARERDGGPARRPRQLPLLVHVAMLLGLTAAVAIGVGALLWTAVGRPALTGAPTPANGWTLTNTFDAMKIILAVVGGIGGVVALTVAYRRQHLGEAAEHREESKERRENTKLFNERFAKAVELIGSDKAAVRLAGVYAVAALADDWPAGRQMCIDVLCAYLRMPARDDDPDGERQVRHSVIRLIRDHLRLSREQPSSWQGRDLDFTGAVLDGGDLSHAVFSGGSVSFTGAVFDGGTVSFEHATFADRGTVSFEGAQFRGGRVSFDETVFASGRVSFDAARFTGARVSFDKAGFSGTRVSFRAAAFADGTVSFDHATVSGYAVHNYGPSSFIGALMSGGTTSSYGWVTFADATFSGSTVSFDDVQFTDEPAYIDTPRFSLDLTHRHGNDGLVFFDRTTFSGGAVSFHRAEFVGGTVRFTDANFCGATVDFSQAVFPTGRTGALVLDDWPAGPPAGVQLPQVTPSR